MKFLAFITIVTGLSTTGGLAAERAKVSQVVDGDTCQLEDGRRLRYLGIDAPEKSDRLGEAATQANNNWVGGKEITFKPEVPAKDRDGRLLVFVFQDGTCINAELVRQGHAHVRRPMTKEYEAALLDAQAEARAAGRGIWSKAAVHKLSVATVQAKTAKGESRDLNDELVVLENQGDAPMDLTGWTVSDETNRRYLVPQFVLPPKRRVTLHTGLGRNTDTDLFWGSRAPIWNDDGDTIFVKDAEGNLVLSHVY